MPVQIPSLQRIGPQAPQSSGQISTAVAQTAPATAAVTGAISTFANQYNDYQVKVQEHADDQIAQRGTNDYEIKVREALGGLRKYQGDPTTAYSELDKKKSEWRDEVLAANPDISGRAKQLMVEKMARADYNLNDRQATQYGVQWETWNQKQVKATTYLNEQKVFDAATMVDLKRPETLNGVGSMLDKTNKDIIDGYGPGAYITGADGKSTINPDVKQQMLKATSDSLSHTIKSLNDAGQVEVGKAIMDKFGHMIDLDTRSKLNDSTKTKEIEIRAIGAVNEATVKYPRDPKAQEAAIGKITDPLVQQKAIEIHSTRITKAKNVNEAQERIVMEDAAKYVRSKNWATNTELRSDPQFQLYISKLSDQKDRDALEQIAFSPKFSDNQAQANMWELVRTEQLATMSDAEFIRATKGLNEKDKGIAIRKRTNAQEVTSAEKEKALTEMHKKLNQVLIREAEALDIESYNGKIDPAVEAKWNTELDNDINNIPAGNKVLTDPIARKQYVENFFANKKKEAAYSPNTPLGFQGPYDLNKFNSKPQKTKSTGSSGKWDEPPAAPTNKLPSLTPAQVKKWGVKWAQEHNGEPFDASKGDDMNAFRIRFNDKLE
jgi:hypothetical protein